ncbi:MAG: pyridoxal phosphate-dependent aminotransferase [Pseudomonadota bacterium]
MTAPDDRAGLATMAPAPTPAVSLIDQPATLSASAAGLLGGGDDDGWAIYIRARQLMAEGHSVYNLAVGDHDTRTDPAIVEAAVVGLREGWLGYAPVPGSPTLRAAAAAQASKLGPDALGPAFAPEEIQLTLGGQAALEIAMRLTLDPGDECVFFDPYYATYPQTVRAAGGVPRPVALAPEDGFLPDPARLAEAIGPRTRAILMNTPNNPTGRVYPPAVLEGIAALAREHDLWVISDEVYSGHTHGNAPHISPRALPGMAGRTLIVGSLSKSHAMTGWRVGWLAGPAKAIGRASDYVVATTYGIPGFIQAAATTALTSATEAEARLAALYRGRAAAAVAAIPEGAGLRALPAEGAMYLLLDIRASGLSAPDFAARLLGEEHIAMMPGESFGQAAAGFLRLALVAPEDEMADIIRRTAACLARAKAG